MAGVELSIEEELEIEFTLPFSGEPIRVAGVVRNRTGYRYGCEFIAEGKEKSKEVDRLRQVLQTFAGEQSS